MIAAEELEEARLRTRRAFHAAKWQGRDAMIEIREIEHEILHPERRALAHRRELRRLQVRVGERRLGAPRARELRERAQHRNDLRAEQREPFAHEHEIRVVGHEGAGRAEMDERPRRGSRRGERLHVRHHIVPEAALELRRLGKIDVVEVRTHLRDAFVGDHGVSALVAHTQLALRLGEGQPELPPGAMAPLRRPQLQHRPRRVALAQRRAVSRVTAHRIMKSVE